ncbi:MAG: N-methyl-L-tryptophan oxidase [Phycisphaerales bacterium]
MRPAYDVVVVGAGGAMGSSAALHLAERGARVLGVDAHALGHARGSSHGGSRLIRMCYFEHPDYVPLLRRAYELWDALAERGERVEGTIFRRTGGVYMGPAGCAAVAGSVRAARAHGLEHEELTRADLAARYPQFCVGEEFVGVFEPEAGYLVPEAVVALQARLARAAGAELRFETPVLEWASDGACVRVRLPDGEVRARSGVLCAGAWMGSGVGGGLGRLVVPTRQVLGWVRPRKKEMFAEGVLPVWAIDAEHLGEGLYYGFPMLGGPHQRAGLKVSRHAKGEEFDPDTPSREPRAEDAGTFRPCLSRWMPEADGPVESMAVCVYENSPDGHFIIDRHPGASNVVVACGFSGHGFKFASVVGEVVAEMVLDGGTRWPVGFLGLGRFGGGEGPRAE